MATKITVMDFINFVNANHEECDITVDGFDSIAASPGVELTEEGKEHFKDALSLPVEDYTVMGETDEDYKAVEAFDEGEIDNGGRLHCAWSLFCAMAGYCRASDHDKWFTIENG